MRPLLTLLCPIILFLLFIHSFVMKNRKDVKSCDTPQEFVDDLLNSHHFTHSRQSQIFSLCVFLSVFSRVLSQSFHSKSFTSQCPEHVSLQH